MRQVYFLCTGNSCRSQMAEGFARYYFPDWLVASAGMERHGLNPLAVSVMAEKGIDISRQRSKLIDPDYFAASDLIITLCGDARDRCPIIPANIEHEHWSFPDPAAAKGSEKTVLSVFRQVRDQIEQQVKLLKG